ncbi:hypothetical protein TWF281_005042 [Arthrobotrys megalospora]
MEADLQIRSPTVEGTLTRAIDRYSKFIKLFKFYPGTMINARTDPAWTSVWIRFAQDYQVCNCWDCEAVLSVVTASLGSDTPIDTIQMAHSIQEEVAYYRAVEIARRKNRSRLPVRVEVA